VTSPRITRHETLTPIIGYGVALLLTVLAFGLTRFQILGGRNGLYAVLGLGLLQLLVHFRSFLHIGLKQSARADLQLIVFSGLIIVLMVGGTLVVRFNLRMRMM
jgi:cytochrome o ubiquinol oxidase operon protein cyoD